MVRRDQQQTLLLAIYKENCDQARHHEIQRERVTSIVGQTAGLVLGLFGFGASSWDHPKTIHLIIPFFLILLGSWGFAASWKHNERSALHRDRIHQYRNQLSLLTGLNLAKLNEDAEVAHAAEFGKIAGLETRTHIIWKLFNVIVALLGLALMIYLLSRLCDWNLSLHRPS